MRWRPRLSRSNWTVPSVNLLVKPWWLLMSLVARHLIPVSMVLIISITSFASKHASSQGQALQYGVTPSTSTYSFSAIFRGLHDIRKFRSWFDLTVLPRTELCCASCCTMHVAAIHRCCNLASSSPVRASAPVPSRCPRRPCRPPTGRAGSS